jgi:hypothetical protein
VGQPVLSFSSQVAQAGGTLLAGLAVFGESTASGGGARSTPNIPTLQQWALGLLGLLILIATLGVTYRRPRH